MCELGLSRMCDEIKQNEPN